MKYLIPAVAISLFCIPAKAQSDSTISSCYLFVDAFNTAETGFAQFREGIEEEGESYELDDMVFTAYTDLELESGTITRNPGQVSLLYPDFEFTQWEFNIQAKRIYPETSGALWETNKPQIEPYFVNLCNWIHDNCVGQLKMSPVYDITAIPNYSGSDKLTCYLYHPSVAIPDSATIEQQIDMLNQVPGIKINLYENWYPKGTYRIEYTIIGVQKE